MRLLLLPPVVTKVLPLPVAGKGVVGRHVVDLHEVARHVDVGDEASSMRIKVAARIK